MLYLQAPCSSCRSAKSERGGGGGGSSDDDDSSNNDNSSMIALLGCQIWWCMVFMCPC